MKFNLVFPTLVLWLKLHYILTFSREFCLVIFQDVAVTRWDQCPKLVLRTESVAVSQDLEDTSVIDVYRLVTMDSQTASVSDHVK